MVGQEAEGHEAVDDGEGNFLVVADFFKARVATEGDRRFVYCEASNESWDQEKERVAKAALLGSKHLFLGKGNVDIDHMTILGHRLGKENPHKYEIGLPAEVKDTPMGGVLVKSEIYRGGPSAGPEFGNVSAADWWWATQVDQAPAMRWFPSVGGKPTAHKMVFDEATGTHRKVITKCIWRNLGFAKEPQNLSVPAVSTIGFDDFIKSVIWANAQPECCGTGECECGVKTGSVKAVTAGYGSDSATLSGGGALRLQSIAGKVKDPFDSKAARYLASLGTDHCEHTKAKPTRASLIDHFKHCEGQGDAEANTSAARLLKCVSLKLAA